MLTNAAVKAAGARSRAYKIFDGRGLFLFVSPAGSKSWRMKFRLAGREKLLTFGTWPDVSLGDARARCDQVRKQLRRGEDPAPRRELADNDSAATFESAARAWHAHQLEGWTPAHAGDVLDSFERDVFPAIGALELDAIRSPAILKLLRAIEARGSIETARRVRQRISAVFSLAISEGAAEHDPAAVVAKALRPIRMRSRQPALLVIDDARELLEAADAIAAAPIVKLASRFLALTAVRLGALRGATWSEFEGIDWAGDFTGPTLPLWRIPAARMKLSAAKKHSREYDHLVPLSLEAVQLLRQARDENGYDTRSRPPADALVFPGRDRRRPIGESAIGDLYARAGYAGRHVPHGWRATFSTVLNERFPADRAAIDRALAHVPKDKVEAAYNRAEQLRRRRTLYQRWAALLSRSVQAAELLNRP